MLLVQLKAANTNNPVINGSNDEGSTKNYL